MKKINIANLSTNAAIDAAAATVGIGSGVYVAAHDVMNDPVMSIKVGVGTGVIMTMATEALLHGIKAAIVSTVDKIETKKQLQRTREILTGCSEKAGKEDCDDD